uniref:Uncharacterized protein n=1 Tax=Pyxicephalus adspersus TaxID=30357 RepID=A0AAV3AL76_PYXAD|nr:TPA: hypothetical protein GDO54_011442 [Pyxicephalus adspersus]
MLMKVRHKCVLEGPLVAFTALISICFQFQFCRMGWAVLVLQIHLKLNIGYKDTNKYSNPTKLFFGSSE